MSKFRIHNSFEEELAKKADEFTLQPRVATWRGVDRGVQKAQSIKQAIRLAIVSTCAIVTIALVYFQNNQEKTLLAETPLIKQSTQQKSADINTTLPPNTPSLPALSSEEKNTQAFSNLRSLPSFEQTNENPDNLVALNEELTQQKTQLSLRTVTPKNIQLSIAGREIDHTQLKRRKRPISFRHKDGWYLQASFTPSLAYRNLSARTAYAETFAGQKNSYDQSVKTYSAKIGLRYFFSDRFSLAFGIGYSQQGEIIGMSARKQSDLYKALAEEYNYRLEEMHSVGNQLSYQNQYHYLQLPVTLFAKRSLSKRLSLHTGVGLSIGYLVKESSRTYDFRVDHYTHNTNFLRTWTVGAHVQSSLAYDINTRWMLSAGPELNYALLSTYQNYYTLNQHQYSLGLNLGVQWKLFDGTKSRGFGLN